MFRIDVLNSGQWANIKRSEISISVVAKLHLSINVLVIEQLDAKVQIDSNGYAKTLYMQ